MIKRKFNGQLKFWSVTLVFVLVLLVPLTVGHAAQLDTDGDTVSDETDNCDETFNPSQSDTDGDEIGDACDNDMVIERLVQEIVYHSGTDECRIAGYVEEDYNPLSTFNIFFIMAPDENLTIDEVRYSAWRRQLYNSLTGGIFDNSVYAANDQLFRLFILTCPIAVNRVSNSSCPTVNIDAAAFRRGEEYFRPNMVVVMHSEPGVKDCSLVSLSGTKFVLTNIGAVNPTEIPNPSDIVDTKFARVLMHEIGHGLGVPDEYPGSKLYWPKPPLMFESEDACKALGDKRWFKAGESCKEFTYTVSGHIKSIYRSEWADDLMSIRGGHVVDEFGEADFEIVKELFAELLIHKNPGDLREVNENVAFSTGPDWDPQQIMSFTVVSEVDLGIPENAVPAMGFEYSSELNRFGYDHERVEYLHGYFPVVPDAGTWNIQIANENAPEVIANLHRFDPRQVHVYEEDSESGEFFHTTQLIEESLIYINNKPLDWAMALPVGKLSVQDGIYHVILRDGVDNLISSTLINPRANTFIPLDPRWPFDFTAYKLSDPVIMIGADLTAQNWRGVYDGITAANKLVLAVEIDQVDQLLPRVTDVIGELGTNYELFIDGKYMNDNIRQGLQNNGIKAPTLIDEQDATRIGFSVGSLATLEAVNKVIYLQLQTSTLEDEQYYQGFHQALAQKNVTVTKVDDVVSFTTMLQNRQDFDFVYTDDPATAKIALWLLKNNGLQDKIQLATRGVSADILPDIVSHQVIFADQEEYRQGYLTAFAAGHPGQSSFIVDAYLQPIRSGPNLFIVGVPDTTTGPSR